MAAAASGAPPVPPALLRLSQRLGVAARGGSGRMQAQMRTLEAEHAAAATRLQSAWRQRGAKSLWRDAFPDIASLLGGAHGFVALAGRAAAEEKAAQPAQPAQPERNALQRRLERERVEAAALDPSRRGSRAPARSASVCVKSLSHASRSGPAPVRRASAQPSHSESWPPPAIPHSAPLDAHRR